MFEIDTSNAADYLRSYCRGESDGLRVTSLGGGVSNTVLLVESAAERFVLKQALGKLRVEQDWFSDRRRIFRECAALRSLAPHLDPGAVPEVLFEDRDNCLFAMTAAPPGAHDWKSLLLRGHISHRVPEAAARILGAMIRISRENAGMENAFGDQTVFDQLRLDPYYRTTASRHPDLKPYFNGLIEECGRLRFSLVHGDWSPKNFLVTSESVMAIDFEVIHYGDPGFDTAFLMNHLALKTFHTPARRADLAALAATFWRVLARELPDETPWLEERTMRHLGGLMLARVDGKSPAEYLRAETREQVRRFARELILEPPRSVTEVISRLDHAAC